MKTRFGRRLAGGLAVLALAAGLAAVSAAPAGAQTVKMATMVPEGSSWHLILKQAAADWKRISNGRVNLVIFAGSVAGDDTDVVRKIRMGTLHAGVLTAVGVAEIEKSVYSLGVPMMYSSYEEVYAVLAKMQPRLEAAMEKKGFVVLTWADAGWNRFFSKSPVRTPDDLKRQKLFQWAGDNDSLEAMKSAGFNVVPLPATEMATALQTGLITALPTTPQVAVLTQYYNYAKNMTDMPWNLLLGATVIKKDVWDRIPADLHAPLRQAMENAGQKLRSEMRTGGDNAVKAMQQRGLTVVPVDPKTRQLWVRTAETAYPMIRGKIVPADAFDEAMRYRDEYRKQHAGGK